MRILSALVALSWGDEESVTLTVKEKVPDPLGVPEIAPVLAFRVRPGGRVPAEIAQVYGTVPPVAFTVVEYALPTFPLGREVVVMDNGATIWNVNDLEADCGGEEESVTLIVAATGPTFVGVPEMVPVDVFNVKPAGKLPEAIDQV